MYQVFLSQKQASNDYQVMEGKKKNSKITIQLPLFSVLR